MGKAMIWGGPPGTWLLGVLADGTTFQHLPETGWQTLVGPQSMDEGVGFAMTVTDIAEHSGGPREFGPMEIAIEDALLAAIAENTGWEVTGAVIGQVLDLHRDGEGDGETFEEE